MIESILWQTAILLLLMLSGLDSAAWFYVGVVFMFWLTVAIASKGAPDDEKT